MFFRFLSFLSSFFFPFFFFLSFLPFFLKLGSNNQTKSDPHLHLNFDLHIELGFFNLLEELTGDELDMSWEELERDHPEFRDDLRFARLSSSKVIRQQDGEDLFEEFMKEKRERTIEEFKEILQQNKFIQYHVEVEARGTGINRELVEKVLQGEKKYKMLEKMNDKGKQMIEDHLAQLLKKAEMEREKRSRIETGVLKDH